MTYGKFQKTFALSVPVDRAWQAFTDAKDLEVWLTGTVQEADVRQGGRIAWAEDDYGRLVWDIVEADPPNKLVYKESSSILPVPTDVTVTFEESQSGTKITVTQAGFGEGENWQTHLDNVGLAWVQTLAALDLYLRTGARFDRFFTFQSGLGMLTDDLLAGPVVLSVDDGAFAAKAGIQRGDIILKLGTAPVFSRSDLWLFNREHPIGEEVEVTYARSGEVLTARAALTEPT
ncbi:SRPBCC domain-containing protein [Kibdelosporangium philippinense]|uniref:SRPBCC domain-containing protein n=1 Tax=Kibdelosporangium philippinense TaxID=211113 RepID=A0ABS8Z423_9PSEU|nr:SRPBCC domain-containing protein [Kibdelosporangium philippinense]MCE7002671.1 SRPBCC domain-containing protein [Kibdelosporangium philippinense]